jgi:hypothetical protein
VSRLVVAPIDLPAIGNSNTWPPEARRRDLAPDKLGISSMEDQRRILAAPAGKIVF